MKKLLLILAIVAVPYFALAQDEAEAPKEGWTKAGNVSLLFSQSAFNAEWQGGGTTNYSVNLTGSYDANYKKDRLTWDNRLMVDYGITNQRDQEFSKKTNDRLEFNSIVGKQLSDTSKWYYSFFFNFRSQITSGYTFGEDANGNEIRTERTKFLSPGYFQAGPGMLWKDSDNLKVNIAPATARLIVVDGSFTEVDATDAVALAAYEPYFGVDANESTRFELGAAIGAYGKFTLLENVSMENVLNLYSNYLEDPQNVDIDYTMNLVMTVNKWITANTTFQAIYDDNAVTGFQIREALAIGVTYGF